MIEHQSSRVVISPYATKTLANRCACKTIFLSAVFAEQCQAKHAHYSFSNPTYELIVIPSLLFKSGDMYRSVKLGTSSSPTVIT